MKLHHVRLGVSLAVAVTLLCACGDAKTDASGNAAVAKVIANPEEAAKVLLLGTGATCDDDRGCESQGVASACVLGTCFGLLTTDTPAARAVLVDRIGNAPPKLRNALSVLLQRAVVSGDAKTRARVAAVEGLGAIAAGDKGECGESCTALRLLRKSTDPQIAAAARLALAAVGQPDVLKDVVDDLQQGTPHLQCAAARALSGYAHKPGGQVARAELEKAANSSDTQLADAAKRALTAWERGT